MEKYASLCDISTKAFNDSVKKAAALENISQEMNVAGRYITHHNAALGTKTRLTCFALIGYTLIAKYRKWGIWGYRSSITPEPVELK